VLSSLTRLWRTLRSGPEDARVERELDFHLTERADELARDGLDRDEARRRARRQFGNVPLQAERTREADVALWLDGALRNLRVALRSLRRTPGFSTAVVLTLALGIGANSAVFSAIDGVLLRPLPFPEGDRLVRLLQVEEHVGVTSVAPVRLQDWRRLSSTFDEISGFSTDVVDDTSGDVPVRVRRALVAPGFLDVLAVEPALGRDFVESEHLFGSPSTSILGDRFWRRRGADPGILDRPTAGAQGQSLYTVGVMPPGFAFPDRDVEIWSAADVDAPWGLSRDLTWTTGIGRLAPGVTLAQAQADLDAVQARLAVAYPDTDRAITVRIEPLKDVVVSDARLSLWLLFGAVSVLLLIACTNIAALLLSRAARRDHEIAVRYSLGASRAAVALQTMTEAFLLAGAGAGLGLAIAFAAPALFRRFVPDLPRVHEIGIDGRILAYLLVATLAVALVCGILPAVRSGRAGVLARAPHARVSPRQSFQWLLVGVQVALSVTLLAGAGLLLRSIEALSGAAPGFDPARVLTLHVSGRFGVETFDDTVRRINRLMDALTALPDVEIAASTSTLPGVPGLQQQEFAIAEGRADTAPRLVAASRIVAPGYFEAVRIPLVAGSLCRRPEDAQGTIAEVIVNRRFADVYFPGRPIDTVLDRHVTGGLDFLAGNGNLASAPPARVAGVVEDAREIGLDRDPVPTVYSCFSASGPAPWFVIRTRGEPEAAAGLLRRRINELEPARSVYDVAPLAQRLGDAYAQDRLRTWLMTLFAVTALGLVCAGVYGTLSYAAGLRRREMAVRLALGALRRTVVRHLVGAGLAVVAAAALVGLLLALGLARGLATLLYGVSPFDPATFVGAIVVVLAVAAAAAAVPAARAVFAPPMQALREE
jgi:predicted permease